MTFRSFIMGVFLLQGLSAGVYAQDTTNTIGNVSIASPTAASLGKYGDYPVSYNTGLPQINIPIYTVKAGSLSLPISLSYHASGLKVQEAASWVGAGWALDAGGCITRTVIGAADDQGLQNANICTNGYYSSYGYDSYLFVVDPYGPNHPGTAFDGYWTDDQNFQWGVKDGEPDLYFFNFGGYSGKFYFNDDRMPVFVPEQDFKVQPDLNNGIGGVGFQGFIVTTPDGVRYYFGMTGNDNAAVHPIEISIPAITENGPAYSNMAVSSWFLNKIVSADGMDSITFTYAKEWFSEYGLSMFPIETPPNSMYPSFAGGYGLLKTFIQGVRLTGINFPNGQISFTASASPRQDLDGYNPMVFTGQPNTVISNNLLPSYSLGSIQISNANGFCQKDSFYYGYFQDNVNTLNGILGNSYSTYNIQSDKYRLRLDSVKETSCDGTIDIPPYTFSYYPELVPRKLSFGVDHWGFYNGVTNNPGLIPSYTLLDGGPVQVFPGANRDAAWPAMRGGTLNKIAYPTGGYTNFTFEPNTTWVNSTNYVPTIRINNACTGCDGSTTPTSVPLTSTGNSYQIILDNEGAAGGGDGDLQITPVGGGSGGFNSKAVPVGSTDTEYCILPAGNYTVTLYKNTVLGAGPNLFGTVTEELPVSYAGNDTVGGLRIKSIVSYDVASADSLVTNYTYTGEYGTTHSSGILYSRPVYVQSLRNDAFGWTYGLEQTGNAGCNLSAATYYLSPTSISPMRTVQGNHIGYNEVDASRPGNGHTTYRYYGSDYWDNIISDVCTRNINTNVPCTSAIPSFPAPPDPYDPMRGELQSEIYFNQKGQELKEVDYTPVYVFDSVTTPGRRYANTPYFRVFGSYSLQSARKVKTTTVTTTVDPSTSSQVSQTSTVYYGSPYHHQPTRTVTTTSTGDSVATNTLYSMDLQVPSCNAIPDSLPYFIDVTNADSVVFFNDLDIPTQSNTAARLDTLANMERHVNLTHLQYLNYRLRSFSGDSSLQKSCHVTAEAGADALLKPILRMQDEFDISPIEVTQWRDNLLLHATFNKYDTSISPVGVVYPDRTQQINLQAASASFTPASVSGNTIAKDARYLDETLFQFRNGNPQQVIPHSGVALSYLWDYLNQHPIAKVSGAMVDQVAYTSFEADGSGGWTIPSGGRVSSASITGGTSYNLGNGNISRSGLTSSSTYLVSYWSTNRSHDSVTGSTSVKQGKTIAINGGTWTYFEHAVTGVGTATISGSGDIDELRCYPVTAQMQTYTYTPLVGMTSQCDVANRITYYYYDGLGRLNYIKDQDGNIVKTFGYHYMNQSAGNSGL